MINSGLALTVLTALLGLTVHSGDCTAVLRHYGDRVLVFTPANFDQLRWLVELHSQEGEDGKLGEKIKFWSGPAALHQKSVVYVPFDVYHKLVNSIPANHVLPWWSVEQENLGKLVEEERRMNFNRAPHTKYLRYAEILNFMTSAAADCGSYCQLEDFGTSYEGRKLQLMKIGDDSPSKRIIWFDAGIHAREWIAPATAIYFIDVLIKGYTSKEPAITKMLQQFTIYIAPLLNPDGYEYTFTNNRYWRKTRSDQGRGCKGVDGNRNFSFKFGGKGSSNNPCSDIYHGPSAFSEPETRAVRDKVQSVVRRTIAFITIHSFGQMLLTPYGYDYGVEAPNHVQLIRAAQVGGNKLASLGTRYKVGNSAQVTYPASGVSDDWARSIGIMYTLTIELPDTGRYGFNLPASRILSVGMETLRAMIDYADHLHTVNMRKAD